VRNKTNLPGAPGNGRRRCGRKFGQEQMCETKPISGSRAAAGRSVAPNKANSAEAAEQTSTWRKGSYGELNMREVLVKQSQFFDCGLGTDLPCGLSLCTVESETCETNPISTHPTSGCNCAKQTRFSPAGRQAGPLEGQSCETKPISGGADGAKQSQLPEAGHRGGVRASSRPMDLESATVGQPHPAGADSLSS